MNKYMVKMSVLSLMLLSGCLAFGGESGEMQFDFAALPKDLKQMVLVETGLKGGLKDFSALSCVNRQMKKDVAGNKLYCSLKLLAQKEIDLGMIKKSKKRKSDINNLTLEPNKKRRTILTHDNGDRRTLHLKCASGRFNLELAQASFEEDSNAYTARSAGSILRTYPDTFRLVSNVLKNGCNLPDPMLLEK